MEFGFPPPPISLPAQLPLALIGVPGNPYPLLSARVLVGPDGPLFPRKGLSPPAPQHAPTANPTPLHPGQQEGSRKEALREVESSRPRWCSRRRCSCRAVFAGAVSVLALLLALLLSLSTRCCLGSRTRSGGGSPSPCASPASPRTHHPYRYPVLAFPRRWIHSEQPPCHRAVHWHPRLKVMSRMVACASRSRSCSSRKCMWRGQP
ncbi:hypothetical protein B0H16DRAFT_1577192 [Mycena metata]|uniref:Uncharacterized protein n=1 Tax=Mycena metata TaxID=1033252 RepID=A0AAD7MVP0_9AGAR|nr:hypothetical protein B0H16DRAFT_1577192 [Mycena metata]